MPKKAVNLHFPRLLDIPTRHRRVCYVCCPFGTEKPMITNKTKWHDFFQKVTCQLMTSRYNNLDQKRSIALTRKNQPFEIRGFWEKIIQSSSMSKFKITSTVQNFSSFQRLVNFYSCLKIQNLWSRIEFQKLSFRYTVKSANTNHWRVKRITYLTFYVFI